MSSHEKMAEYAKAVVHVFVVCRFFLYRESASPWTWTAAMKTSRRTTTTTTTTAPGRQTDNDETSKILRVRGLWSSSESGNNDRYNNNNNNNNNNDNDSGTSDTVLGRQTDNDGTSFRKFLASVVASGRCTTPIDLRAISDA